jgi:adenylate cyclase
MTIALAGLTRCFDAVLPGMLTTCSRDGMPNIIAVSYVHRIDDTHVAISRQFFKKTHQNLVDNPHAQVAVMDPLTMDTYRLDLRFSHEETSGPLFDIMQARVDAVASQTGMSGVFRVAAAGVFEVLAVEQVRVLDTPHHSAAVGLNAIDSMTQLRALRRISDIARACEDAETLLDAVLGVLDEVLGFEHSMLLLVDESAQRLFAIASRGYPQSGIGAEVRIGEGVIGTVAKTRRLLRMSSLDRDLRYARATRDGVDARDEIPLPGLADVRSQLAIPLVVKDELLGVLAVESRHLMQYGERDEAFLEVVAGQVALALQTLLRADVERDVPVPTAEPAHRFAFYAHDDCVFLDGEYLVRNIPGRMLWKLLQAYVRDGRVDFSNRELRLDTTLGLPQLRDNLESRLILLRKRLAERCTNVRLVPTARGRFRLDVRGRIELVEHE